MKGVFLFFVDGLGLGPRDGEVNPLAGFRFESLPGPLTIEAAGQRGEDFRLLALDATMGVKGLPQSATGQAAILTGRNTSGALGRHVNGRPGARLREMIAEDNLLKGLVRKGLKVRFINAYRDEFFRDFPDGPYRPSVSTVAVHSASLPFSTMEDLREGRAVYHDIDNHTLTGRGYGVEPVDPAAAGRVAARLSLGFDLTFFEHFITDSIGHYQDRGEALEALHRLDQFLGGLLPGLPGDTLLLLCSDHGNLEDLSVRTHTANPVPLLLIGAGQESFGEPRSITGIRGAIEEWLAN